MESGCALFAALREEDLIYSQPKNQLTLNLSFELKPEETFLSRTSDWAKAVGIISWTATRGGQRVHRAVDLFCVGSVGFGISSGEQEDKEARGVQRSSHLGLKLSGGGLLTGGTEGSPRRPSGGLGIFFPGGRGWITSRSPEISGGRETRMN